MIVIIIVIIILILIIFRRGVKRTHPRQDIKVLTTCAGLFNNRSRGYELLIDCGNVYKTGVYPLYRSNPDMAVKCFALAARCPNKDVRILAKGKIMETLYSPVAPVDDVGAPIPVNYGQTLCDLATQRLPQPLPPNPPERPPPQMSDAQNVHDYGVTGTIANRIATLQNVDPIEACVESEVKNSFLDEDTKLDAIRVIQNLNDKIHSKFGISEQQALAKVWSKIHKDSSSPIALEQHKELLFRQLASGVENGVVVCSTGKIARILGALDGTELADTKTIPMSVIRDRIATLAAAATSRTEFVAAVTAEISGVMGPNSEHILTPIIEEYAEHIE